MSINRRIRRFNEERGMLAKGFNLKTAYSMLAEELQELIDADSEHETVDALADLIVIASGELSKLDYDIGDVMHETLLEIESRKQNPIQADEWKTKGASGKWLKNKEQDKKTLYSADYSKCKYKCKVVI